MMQVVRTIQITALHEWPGKSGSRLMLELSGHPMNSRPGSDGTIGYTQERDLQDQLYCADQGTRIVTVGLVPGHLGTRIVSVQEVEAIP